MKNENENVEIIEEDEIVTLYDDENNPVDFYEVACVEYENDFYALLEPVEEMEGIEDGEDLFLPVESEELLNAVFEEYLRVASEHECDGECDHCAGECDHH